MQGSLKARCVGVERLGRVGDGAVRAAGQREGGGDERRPDTRAAEPFPLRHDSPGPGRVIDGHTGVGVADDGQVGGGSHGFTSDGRPVGKRQFQAGAGK